jgi:hypothetical protein
MAEGVLAQCPVDPALRGDGLRQARLPKSPYQRTGVRAHKIIEVRSDEQPVAWSRFRNGRRSRYGGIVPVPLAPQYPLIIANGYFYVTGTDEQGSDSV